MKKVIVLILVLLSCFTVVFTASCESTQTTGSNNEQGQVVEQEEDTTCVVMFDSNGGTEVANLTLKKGDKITKPQDPTRVGDSVYTFKGWYLEGKKWDFENTTVESNMVLTAQWEAEEIGTKNYLPED